ncbi:MAG: hypothetical protein WCK01_00965 [Candidatus Uhrbacteria bacterium]
MNDLYHYRVHIESATRPLYAELIKKYGKENVNELWDESKHEQYIHESLRDVAAPIGMVTLLLKEFDHSASTNQAIQWAHACNYRLTFPWEREAFSRSYPEFQRNRLIADLGSLAHERNERITAILTSGASGPILGGGHYDRMWNVSDHFLFASA